MPETQPFYFTGEAPIANGVEVTFDTTAQRVTFYIRMDDKSADEKVSFKIDE